MTPFSINETIRVFPRSKAESPVTVPLSILDAPTARFAPTGCIWIFDHHDEMTQHHTLLDCLRESFVTTLSEFPQWAGQLQWAPFNPDGGHTERFNRPRVVYGSDQDPGVEWKTVSYPSYTSDQFAPRPSERASMTTWRGDQFDQSQLISDSELALHDLETYQGLPAMTVQLSLFGDGGYAVGITLAHVLGDAQSLLVFVHRWAANSRDLHGHTERPSLMQHPIFNPQQLDAQAAGNIDGDAVDPHLADDARALPLYRYDCWESDAPEFLPAFIPLIKRTTPPAWYLKNVKLSPAESAPWTTWDVSRSTSYVQIHFTGTALKNLQSLVRSELTEYSRLSRLDVLLAYLWSAVNRARGMTQASEDVSLDLTLGARTRVPSRLLDSWIGSPLLLTHVKQSGASVCSDSIGSLASTIRNTIALFTPEKLGSILHDAAYEVSPQRLWQGFVGRNHLLVTSWQRLEVHQVDFEGTGIAPRYVHAVMPKVDGLLQVFDAAIDDGGMDASLYLDTEAMDRLLADETFGANIF